MRKIILFVCLVVQCAGALFAEPQKKANDFGTLGDDATYGNMYQWRSHAAFTSIDQVVIMGDRVYGLSSNSLFAVNKYDGEIEYCTKLNGLSSSVIDHIAYNEDLDRMLITYRNGQIDIMASDGTVYNISDLFFKQMTVSKQVNDICMYQDKAILAMSFGVLIVDMDRVEISDTYYIGDNGAEVNVRFIAVANDTVYAASDEWMYYANLADNINDYAYWHTMTYPAGKINGMRSYQNLLRILVDQKLYMLQDTSWQATPIPTKNPPLFRSLCVTINGLYALPNNRYGAWRVYSDTVSQHLTYGYNNAIQEDEDNRFWLGSSINGLVCLRKTNAPEYQTDIQEYYPKGPSNNYAYRLKFYGDKLYMLPGGRWASQYKRPGHIMIYENNEWKNITNTDLVARANGHALTDFMNVAQDPNDESHYFITTYGTGLLEMQDTNVIKLHLPSNSGLVSAVEGEEDAYTRTDGAMYDEQGNLWVLNMGESNGNVHVISPQGKWHSFDLFANGSRVILHTAGEILVDSRNSQWKWIPILRNNTGLILLNDNATPTNHADDDVTYRTRWMDQNSNQVAPNQIRAIAQDQSYTLWVGTSSGIFAIPSYVDFTSSNQCVRVVIPRNDGTKLGDYLLDNEQINTIAIDGANRLWVGTASSGAFLLAPVGSISDPNFTVETVAHFTAENSIMPSNDVQSIAIHESTGEVFIATGGGLVSYMSDATESEEDFTQIYAYPNPVHPNYQGYITIKGLMGDSEIRIVDPSGNLVKILQGTGGSVAWDGTNAQGQRVASGVYTALCNTKSGKGHGWVKILIMN